MAREKERDGECYNKKGKQEERIGEMEREKERNGENAIIRRESKRKEWENRKERWPEKRRDRERTIANRESKEREISHHYFSPISSHCFSFVHQSAQGRERVNWKER